MIITEDLTTFCQNHNHRPADMFAEAPWPRAMAYIAAFPPAPQINDE